MFDMFTRQNMGVNVSAYLVDNKITNAQYFNNLTNLQTTTPQNVQDNLGANANLRYGFTINKLKSSFRTSISFGLNRGYSVIDDQENLSSTYNYGGKLTWRNTNTDILSARVGASIDFNQNEIELGSQQSSQYVNTKIFGDFDFELKKDWEFGIKGTQNLYSGKSLTNPQNFFLLDAYVSKIILKNGKGTLGKLMTDDKMYTNLTNASKEMEELLREMKLNPKRFVHFSLFGKKAKPFNETNNTQNKSNK